MHDEFVEVPDVVAEELLADRRYHKANRRRTYRNKAQYSLDTGDGIESEAIYTSLTPYEVIERQGQEAERIQFEKKAAKSFRECEQYNKNVKVISENFSKNLSKYVDDFYENFINAIKIKDFDTAFGESMSLIKNSETTSYNNISYSDMSAILAVMKNIPIEFDEYGEPTKYRLNITIISILSIFLILQGLQTLYRGIINRINFAKTIYDWDTELYMGAYINAEIDVKDLMQTLAHEPIKKDALMPISSQHGVISPVCTYLLNKEYQDKQYIALIMTGTILFLPTLEKKNVR